MTQGSGMCVGAVLSINERLVMGVLRAEAGGAGNGRS